jgi:hypothetical protein
MKKAAVFFMVTMAILSAAGLASEALARGGHRGTGRMGGDLCLSGAMLDLSLGRPKAALEELKKGAKEYSDSMSRICAEDSPADVPAKLAVAQKRLDAALTGVHKLEPRAQKFYVTLNDEQKARTNVVVVWPGL